MKAWPVIGGASDGQPDSEVSEVEPVTKSTDTCEFHQYRGS